MKTFISSQKIFTVFFPLIIMVFLIGNTAWGLRPSIGNTKNISQTIHKNVRQALKPTFNIQSRYADEMTGIAVSRNANLMASASKNGAAQLWDMNTGQRIKDFRKGSSPVLSLDFVPGGKYLLTGSKNSNIYLWDLNTGRPVQEFQGHGGPVYKIKAMGNGRSFISSGKKGNVHIWDIGQEKPVRNFIKHKDDVLALANSRISRLAVSGGEDEKIYMWDWQTGDLLNTFEESDDITALVLSPDDRYLAAGLDNGSISIWDLNSGEKIYAEKIHNYTVLGMAISPDGRYLASSGINAKGDDNRIIYICSLPDGQKIRWMEGHEDGSCVNDIQFSLNSRYIISAGEDKTARFWDMNSGKELVRMVSMRSGWAVVSPEGYFDGSLEGESEDRLDAIRWTVGERSIAMDGFLENYYRPALLGRLLAGQTVADKGLPFVSEGFVLPPKVGITGPKNNSRILDRRIIVQVESVEENGDIDEIRLFHNEKFIDDSKAKRKKEKNGKRIV
ncbi:MAG: WD40 repeat domain-containing protein, partial [Desulfococcaceae bacterium]|nr:WD40 repeat domain-containing protein [Desulfococcaceae bacterium]